MSCIIALEGGFSYPVAAQSPPQPIFCPADYSSAPAKFFPSRGSGLRGRHSSSAVQYHISLVLCPWPSSCKMQAFLLHVPSTTSGGKKSKPDLLYGEYKQQTYLHFGEDKCFSLQSSLELVCLNIKLFTKHKVSSWKSWLQLLGLLILLEASPPPHFSTDIQVCYVCCARSCIQNTDFLC